MLITGENDHTEEGVDVNDGKYVCVLFDGLI